MIAEENWQTTYYLHATYAYLGRTKESRSCIKMVFPQFNLTAVRMDAFYRHGEDMEHYLTGLRRAGVTEFPYGFQPAEHVDQRLSGEKCVIFYGRSFEAFAMGAGCQLSSFLRRTGSLASRHDISDTSPTRVEGDKVCFRFAVITRAERHATRFFLTQVMIDFQVVALRLCHGRARTLLFSPKD